MKDERPEPSDRIILVLALKPMGQSKVSSNIRNELYLNLFVLQYLSTTS
jgi:hypothetical protein